MPLFQYRSKESGLFREFLLAAPAPAEHFDNEQTWVLEPIQAFAVSGCHTEPSMGDEVLGGYRQMEQKLGSRFSPRLPAEKIKAAWADEVTK